MTYKKSLINLLLSKWISTFGLFLQSAVLPIIVFKYTGSSSLLSWILFAETLPWLILAPFITNIVVTRISNRHVYLIANLAKSLSVLLLSLWIDNHTLVLVLFFAIGTLNAIQSTVYSAILKYNTEDDNLSKILGVSLGIDDVVSIIAPLIVTYAISRSIDAMLFLYINAIALFISGVLVFRIKSKALDKREPLSAMRNLLAETFQNYALLRKPQILYVLISEFIRSFVEGLFIPLLIVYVISIINNTQELFTIGATIMAVAQVIMSLIYIYLKKRFDNYYIINIGTLLMAGGIILLVVYPNVYAYCIAALFLGLGMAVRQLISENVLIASYEADDLSKAISAYNSLISLAYLLGYIMSALQGYIASVQVYFIVGAICMLSPIVFKKYAIKP